MRLTDHTNFIIRLASQRQQQQKIKCPACPTCSGWGKVEMCVSPAHKLDVPCSKCNGTGKLSAA